MGIKFRFYKFTLAIEIFGNVTEYFNQIFENCFAWFEQKGLFDLPEGFISCCYSNMSAK